MNFTLATRFFCLSLGALFLQGVCLAPGLSAEELSAGRLSLYPKHIELRTPGQRQSVIAVWEVEQIVQQQIPAEQLEWEIEPANLARREGQQLIPLQNGEGVVKVKFQDQLAEIPLIVQQQEEPTAWSFRNHVQSVLTKQGCNSGACHGAAAGKNGFRLSLRGYDPEFDFLSITRQARGRRIVPTAPEKSLLLTKPTGQVPHKGGLLLSPGERDYQVLAEWIAAGQPAPSDKDLQLESLAIFPQKFRLKPGDQLQLIVQAQFSDGHQEDVTSWTKFTSHNESVVGVDDQGLMTVRGEGEGSILAWFLAQNEIATISVPLQNDLPSDLFAQQETSNLIDRHVIAKLQHLNIPPSEICTDDIFLRRLFLDTIGTLPTAEETRQFLADQKPGKRERMIETVLTRPEFVDYWTYRWSDLLLVTGRQLRPQAVEVFSQWIRNHVEKNTPWDELVEELILSRGSTLQNGATNFYALHRDPLSLTENVSMAFLGMSMNCARCHDHPLEKWTNDDYFGMVSLFARVKAKGWGGESLSGNGERIVFLASEGEVIQPRTGKPQPPHPLDGPLIDFENPQDRRIELARWLTAPENPYFTKAIVNRVWANFLGVGIVESVDDLRLTNPPSNPELLEALAGYLIDQNYDLRQLMKLILTSHTYQRSSSPLPGNLEETRYYSRYYPKRLRAEVLLDAVSQVTDVPTAFTQIQRAGGGFEKVNIAAGTKAQQLSDTSIVSYFLETFGRPERLTTCECERSSEPSMSQVLHIMNGTTLDEKLSTKQNRLQKHLDSGLSSAQIVEQAYLEALSRSPQPEEQQAIAKILEEQTTPEQRREALEDFYWSLLSGNEFLFNH